MKNIIYVLLFIPYLVCAQDDRIYNLSTATTTSNKYVVVDGEANSRAENYLLDDLIYNDDSVAAYNVLNNIFGIDQIKDTIQVIVNDTLQYYYLKTEVVSIISDSSQAAIDTANAYTDSQIQNFSDTLTRGGVGGVDTSETLTATYIPVATGGNSIGNSNLTTTGQTLNVDSITPIANELSIDFGGVQKNRIFTETVTGDLQFYGENVSYMFFDVGSNEIQFNQVLDVNETIDAVDMTLTSTGGIYFDRNFGSTIRLNANSSGGLLFTGSYIDLNTANLVDIDSLDVDGNAVVTGTLYPTAIQLPDGYIINDSSDVQGGGSGTTLTAGQINDLIYFKDTITVNDTIDLFDNENYFNEPLLITSNTNLVLNLDSLAKLKNHCTFSITAYNTNGTSIISDIISNDGSNVTFDNTEMISTANVINRWIGSVWYTGTRYKTDVNWADSSIVEAVDIVAPTLLSAEIGTYNDSVIVALFDEALLSDSVPAASAFTVNEGVAIFGVNAVNINSDTLFLAMDSTGTADSTYTLSYMQPASGRLQDLSNNLVASFSDSSVTNNIVAPVAVPTDYLGAWLFSGNTLDESDSSYDATATDITYRNDRNGLSNAAGDFNGTTSFAEFTSTDFINGLDSITLSIWVYADSLNGNDGLFMSGTSTTNYLGLQNTNTNDITSRVNGNTSQSIATGVLNTEAWTHVLMTWATGEGIKVYVNGTLQQTGAAITGPISNVVEMRFGEFNSNFFNGALDDAYIYGRVLTSGEINALANN